MKKIRFWRLFYLGGSSKGVHHRAGAPEQGQVRLRSQEVPGGQNGQRHHRAPDAWWTAPTRNIFLV